VTPAEGYDFNNTKEGATSIMKDKQSLSGATADTSSVAESKDRRASRRFAYRGVKAVAPYGGKQFPTSEMFRQVQFRDLSRGGMSFIWPHAFEAEQVVIRMAAPGRTIHLVARVVYSRPTNENGFLIGCQFLDTVHRRVDAEGDGTFQPHDCR
jgi:hypothetical protein